MKNTLLVIVALLVGGCGKGEESTIGEPPKEEPAMSTDSIKVLVAGSDGVVISEYLLGEGACAIGSAPESAIPVETAAAEHARSRSAGG